ncbi:MAG: orotate phosphoribosyltransferase-like protein [Thermoplasmata archaeon]|nr:orotate phosphoribosyltransferase-like protein [Thermoplasmata archaeon]
MTEKLKKKAMEFRSMGFDPDEIAREMNLSRETVAWLLSRSMKDSPPADAKIGWRSIGVFPHRMRLISEIMVDIVFEEMEKGDFAPDTVIGVAHNGIVYGAFTAEELGIEFTTYRPAKEGTGGFGANYASVDGKEVVIVDDVLDTGRTVRGVIDAARANNADPKLVVVLLNKTEMNEIDGVPLRSLIRARVIAGER